MHRVVLLAAYFVTACSGKQEGDANQTAGAANKKAPPPIESKNEPFPPVALTRRGFDPPRLYVNDRGVHFEIYELDGLPYDGKIVTYHNRDQKIIASEKVFEKGRLSSEHEYWPNAKPKILINHNLGASTTNRYDQLGNEINPTPIATNNPAPQTRSLNWTYNYNGGNARLEALKNTSLLLQYLGEPNDKLNNGWTYRNMRITDTRARRQHAIVRFNISGSAVSSVTLLQ